MKAIQNESEKKNISTIIYIAIGCLFLALLIAATIYSQTVYVNRLPLVDVYIVEDGSIDFTYNTAGIMESGNLIVSLDFAINHMDQLLLAAIPPGSEATLTSDTRVSNGTVTAILPSTGGVHGAIIEITPDEPVFQDGEIVDVDIYCEGVRLDLPIVPISALVRTENQQSTQYNIYLLDMEDGPWGSKNVVVQKRGAIAWPEVENAEYVFLIGVEIDKPVVLGIDSGFMLDGMEVRTPRGFSFDYDSASLSNNTQENDWVQDILSEDNIDTTIVYPVKDGLSGTLVISCVFGFLPEALADNFMKIYPDVSIEVISADNFSFETLSEYSNRLRVQLMSGEDTPDIIDMSFLLDYYKAADSGMIIDLYPFWNSDPDITQDDYFMNIIELYEYNGGLYAMPSSFSLNTVRLNKRVTDFIGIDVDSIDVMNAFELLDIYLSALDKGVIEDDFRIFYGDPGRNVMLGYIYEDFFDPVTKTARFNTPEFIEFLEKSDQIPTTQTVFSGYVTSDSVSQFESANNTFLLVERLGFDDDTIGFFSGTPDTSKGIIVLTPDGGLTVNTRLTWAISSSCENPELAWEFIKYCIIESDRVSYFQRFGEWNGDRWLGSIPINRNNFHKRLIFASDSPQEFSIGIEDKEKLLELFESVNTISLTDTLIFEMNILDILTLYLDQGLITAEEAARQLQERAEIYFGE